MTAIKPRQVMDGVISVLSADLHGYRLRTKKYGDEDYYNVLDGMIRAIDLCIKIKNMYANKSELKDKDKD